MIKKMKQPKKSAIIGICTILAFILLTTIFMKGIFNQRKVNTLLDLGQKYLTDMSYENAVVVFDEIIVIDPKCEQAYIGKAQAQYALGKYEDAIVTLQDGIDKVNDSAKLEEFLWEILDELIEIETNEETVFKTEEKSEYLLEEQEVDGNEAMLKQVLEAWQKGGIDEVNVLAAQGSLQGLKESIGEGESCYYGEYDDEGKRSGMGVAAYKIYDVWEPNYEFIYFYVGEWKDGVREGKGDWFDIQRAQYQCNWVNDMPEGNIIWYEEGYEGYYIYCWEGVVVHGLFDGILSGTYHKNDEASNFLTYSNGHLDYIYIDFFGDYAIEKKISSFDEVEYSGIGKEKYQEYEHITHGIPGFADTQYNIKAGDLTQVTLPPTD